MADKKQFNTVDDYIKTFPSDVQAILKKMRQTIHHTVPDATEAISYAIPAFNLDGKYVVYFSAWKNHVSLYPVPSGNEGLLKEIAPYIHGKGTIQFPLDKPVPYDLVKKITLALAQDNQQRS
ncbi:MAG TPA: DUF1801 domain-containing protein [Nevskiaceae bacterium]|nr:DUF1801 domain-containing protein [Nevskiaceae bacterium]